MYGKADATKKKTFPNCVIELIDPALMKRYVKSIVMTGENN